MKCHRSRAPGGLKVRILEVLPVDDCLLLSIVVAFSSFSRQSNDQLISVSVGNPELKNVVDRSTGIYIEDRPTEKQKKNPSQNSIGA